MTHGDTQSDLFMCNEFRAAVWFSKKRGKVQSFRGLKAQEKNLLHQFTQRIYTHSKLLRKTHMFLKFIMALGHIGILLTSTVCYTK